MLLTLGEIQELAQPSGGRKQHAKYGIDEPHSDEEGAFGAAMRTSRRDAVRRDNGDDVVVAPRRGQAVVVLRPQAVTRTPYRERHCKKRSRLQGCITKRLAS
jgi:hypothetical protein